jgi:ribosome biogenesis protein BRX1
MNDLASLMPHAKKDAKLDTKSKLYHLNELADLYNCNNVLFFESRKRGQDLYIWMAKAPNGPSVKLHLQNCSKPRPLSFGSILTGSTYNV